MVSWTARRRRAKNPSATVTTPPTNPGESRATPKAIAAAAAIAPSGSSSCSAVWLRHNFVGLGARPSRVGETPARYNERPERFAWKQELSRGGRCLRGDNNFRSRLHRRAQVAERVVLANQLERAKGHPIPEADDVSEKLDVDRVLAPQLAENRTPMPPPPLPSTARNKRGYSSVKMATYGGGKKSRIVDPDGGVSTSTSSSSSPGTSDLRRQLSRSGGQMGLTHLGDILLNLGQKTRVGTGTGDPHLALSRQDVLNVTRGKAPAPGPASPFGPPPSWITGPAHGQPWGDDFPPAAPPSSPVGSTGIFGPTSPFGRRATNPARSGHQRPQQE